MSANNLNEAMDAVDKLDDDQFLYVMAKYHRRQQKIIDALESKKQSLLSDLRKLARGQTEDLEH